MEERLNEESEVQGKTKTIGTNQIVVSKETPINLISQQVINKYSNHDYVDSQLLDFGVNKLMTSKQTFVDLMTQHGTKGIYSVDNTRSLH